MPRTYSELYISVRNRLRDAGIEAAELEGKLIVATAAGKTTEKLLRDMRFYATDEVERRTESMLGRRLAGEPVAYITGVWEFRGLPMEVNPSVLIPRVDTEVLAETAIRWLHGRKMDARVLDLCSGSGCIGCAIAVIESFINVSGKYVQYGIISPNFLCGDARHSGIRVTLAKFFCSVFSYN